MDRAPSCLGLRSGRWPMGSRDSGLVVYNSKLVNLTNLILPRHLNPKWKGKIVMRDPRDDGVQSHRTFFYVKLGRNSSSSLSTK